MVKLLNILIAEDDAVNFMLLEAMLKRFECNVIWVKNGAEAVDLIKSNQEIGLVFMDIKMPVMDGITATEHIRKIRPELPVVAQTAFDILPDKLVLFEKYLKKPINKLEFESIVDTYI